MSEIPPQWAQPNPQPAAMYQPPRVAFESISLAWKVITTDLWVWAGASALMLLVVSLIMVPVMVIFFTMISGTMIGLQTSPGHVDPSTIGRFLAMEGFFMFAMLFVQPFHFIFYAGMMDMALRRMDGQPIAATDVFVGFRRFGPLYVAGLLYAIAIYIGMFACYIGAFIALGLLCFVPIIVLRGQARGLEALKMSWRILVGEIWMITLLVSCAQFLSILGEIACFVGVLFTLPLMPVTIAMVYRNFFPPSLQPTEGPRA